MRCFACRRVDAENRSHRFKDWFGFFAIAWIQLAGEILKFECRFQSFFHLLNHSFSCRRDDALVVGCAPTDRFH